MANAPASQQQGSTITGQQQQQQQGQSPSPKPPVVQPIFRDWASI